MILLYQFILQIIWLLKPVFCIIPHKKIQFFFKNEGKIKSLYPISEKPIWIHASSGEIEYAKSVIRELKQQFPHLPLLVTHTSLSSEKAVGDLSVQAWGVAPLDTPQDVKKFLTAWNPRACLIARTDLWPQTLHELSKAHIPTFLFSATFAKGSKKTAFLSRQLLKTALPLLKKIYFVSAADEQVCRYLYPQICGQIMGDTRYDQVLFRLQEVQNLNLSPFDKILIAGSTWAEDEKVLLPAFAQLKKLNWKFILVPHEVSPKHIASLQAQLAQLSLRSTLSTDHLHNMDWTESDVLLVNQIGILASLYPLAKMAFVGGSFKKQVHSVMEALAANNPVLVGPFYQNNREAIEFKKLGFVADVNSSEQFIHVVKGWEPQLRLIRPQLEKEVQSRLGTTQKIILDLKAEGVLI